MMRTSKLAAGLPAILLLGLSATYVLAQPKPGGPKQAAALGDAGAAHEHACMHEGAHCPLHDLLAIAELKVEKTKTGAALQLVAKDPAKVGAVQSLADKLAEHAKNGGCEMMKDKGAMMHGHQHGK